jgi:putative transposase
MTDLFKPIRNSHMEFDKVYFWTDTVKDWKPIFKFEDYKRIIVSSLAELVNRGSIAVYAFVIMPNHIHLIWEMKEMNGKESPVASFNKFTSHSISRGLKVSHPELFNSFIVKELDRKVRIWQRDPLAILMDGILKVEQKINYIHNNPLQDHWNLALSPEGYKWSSALFYETGFDEFGFLTDYRERF